MTERMEWLVTHGSRERALSEGEHYVGRGDECTIRLDDDLVSRRHAAFTVRGKAISVRDLDSRNGVFIKQRRLARGERATLGNGDAVLVGRTTLYVRWGAAKKVERADPSVPRLRELASTGVIVAYDAFLTEADRAFAQGDLDRYARATHMLLASLAAAIGRGLPEDAPAIRTATRHALKLVELRGLPWVDELLVLYESRPLVLPLEAVSTLKRLFSENRWRSPRLRAYIERVRPLLSGEGARGRALLRELESIESRHPSARPP